MSSGTDGPAASAPGPAPAPGPSPGARPSRGRHLAMFAGVACLVALDLWSKAEVFAWLDSPEGMAEVGRSENGHPRYRVFGLEWLGFMLNLNYGAAFGQGSGAQGVLVVGRCAAAVFLSVLIWRAPTGQRVYLASLVLILAGALGNLYDNFFYEPGAHLSGFSEGRRFGPVRDFIDVYFTAWEWHFPTFNVADSCITVGAVLLLASGFLGTGDEDSRESPGEGAAAG